MKYGDSVERYKRFDGMTVVCIDGYVHKFHEFLILPMCLQTYDSRIYDYAPVIYSVVGVRYLFGKFSIHSALIEFSTVYEVRNYVDFLLGGGNNAQ